MTTESAGTLGERIRSVTQALGEAHERLAATIGKLEEALHAHHTKLAMVRLTRAQRLCWDGEFLWVIGISHKTLLRECTRPMQREAMTDAVLRELITRAGIALTA